MYNSNKFTLLCFVSLSSLVACENQITTNEKFQEEESPTEETENSTVEDQDEQMEEGNDTPEPEETEEEEETEPAGETCTYLDFDVAASRAFVNGAGTAQPLFVYQAANTTAYPMDVLEVLSYPGDPYNGPDSPGTYSLDGNNYADCSLCLLIYAGCGETSCEAMFFADAGAVTFNSNADVNEDFSATLHNVVFREVTVDQSTYESTPVVGGEVWCVDSLSLNALPTAQ